MLSTKWAFLALVAAGLIILVAVREGKLTKRSLLILLGGLLAAGGATASIVIS